MRARLLMVALAAIIATLTITATINLNNTYTAGFMSVSTEYGSTNIYPPSPSVTVTQAKSLNAYLWAFAPQDQDNALSVTIQFAEPVAGSVGVFPVPGVKLRSVTVYQDGNPLFGYANSTYIRFGHAGSLRIDIVYVSNFTPSPSGYIAYISLTNLTRATTITISVK